MVQKTQQKSPTSKGLAGKRAEGKGVAGKRVAKGSPPLATLSGAPTVSSRSLEQAIGAQIRDSRKAANLTVSELAASADISTGMLSKIENGQISPSLQTLLAVSAALSLPMSVLLSAYESRRGCSLVRSGEGAAIRRRGTKAGHMYNLLGHSIGGGGIAFEPYLITLSKDAEPYTEFRHEGIEMIYMLSGEVSYMHGGLSYHLKPGDTLLFDSAEAHGPDKLIKLPATYLAVITYSRT